jgi:hypothetical protein
MDARHHDLATSLMTRKNLARFAGCLKSRRHSRDARADIRPVRATMADDSKRRVNSFGM